MNFALILSAIAAGVSSFTLGPHKTFKPQPLTQRGFSTQSADEFCPAYADEIVLDLGEFSFEDCLNVDAKPSIQTPSIVNLYHNTSPVDEMCQQTLMYLACTPRFMLNYKLQNCKLKRMDAIIRGDAPLPSSSSPAPEDFTRATS
jgi:hypothetical protein